MTPAQRSRSSRSVRSAPALGFNTPPVSGARVRRAPCDRGSTLTSAATMDSDRRPDQSERQPASVHPSIDEQLLARAAEINESVADEFGDCAASPMENPL